MKLPNIIFICIPLIDPVSFFRPIEKLSLEVGDTAINFLCLAARKVVDPISLVKKFMSRQLSITVCLVVSYAAPIEASIFTNEQSLLAFGYSVVEASLIKRSVIIDNSTEPMRQSIFPAALIISPKVKKIVQVKIDSPSFRIMRCS